MRWATATLIGWMCAGQLAFPRSSHAAGGEPAVAEALFQKGRAAMEHRDFETACSAFGESARLDPAPGTLFNLAECEAARGNLASAWQWYSQVAAKLPAGDERKPFVDQRVAALRARLGFVTVRLAPSAPPGTKVVVDATELGAASLGLALPLDPGAHRFDVSAEGHAPKFFNISLREGEQRELVVEPGAASAPIPAPEPVAAPAPTLPPSKQDAPPRPSSTGHSTRDVGYVVGGVGVVGIGAALVLGGIALGKKGTVDDDCNTSTVTCRSQTGIDASSSGKTIATVSTVSFIVGAAALGAGIYLVVSSKDSPQQTALSVAPSPWGGTLGLRHEF